MNITFDQSVNEVLTVVTADHRMKPNKVLFDAWKKGLYGLSPQTIIESCKLFLQIEHKFMPSVGEFRKVCEKYNADKIIKERRESTDRPPEPLDKKEAKRAYQNITSKLKSQTSSNDRPKLVLYDYLDMEANLDRVQCNGHININFFNSQCVIVHKRPPLKTFHQWQLWKKIVKLDEKGRAERPYHSYVICDPHVKGAELITIGYYNTVDYTQSHNNQEEF